MAINLASTIKPVTNADFVITLADVTSSGVLSTNSERIYWTQFSGIKVNYKRATYTDGLSAVMRTTSGGVKEYQNITIGKPYDPDKDQAVITWIKEKESSENTFNVSLSVVKRVSTGTGTTDIDAKRTWNLTGCRIMTWSVGDGIDTSDGTKPVMLTLEFSVESAEYGATNEIAGPTAPTI